MNLRSKEQGFTLIELLLVVVIIGILLAVIVPRAWRANVDAKYGLVRQNATELASFAQQWAESQMEASDLTSTATLSNYLDALSVGGGDDGHAGRYVADSRNNEFSACWTIGDADDVARTIDGRRMDGGDTDAEPEISVEGIVPPERLPRNPFNGASVFAVTNYPPDAGSVIPGALAASRQPDDGNFYYYGLIFQGTDNELAGQPHDADFHAGQDATTLAGLRNGIFMARTAQP